VTHNHHRSTFELLLTDVEQHCRGAGPDSRRGPSAYRQSGRPQTRSKMLLGHLLRPPNQRGS
jgi:hypothetical protein